jgi:hypothetical protein
MDRPQRPETNEPSSIFTKPDPLDHMPASAPLEGVTELDPLDVSTWGPPTSRADDGSAPPPGGSGPSSGDRNGPSRRMLIGLAAAGGAAILAIGFIAFSVLSSDDPPPVAAGEPSPTSSVAATAEPTVEATPQPTASPEPTPEPTPTGPPVELAVGDWATVTADELHVRAAAGENQDSRYRLVRGAVLTVAEGPVAAKGGNWYRIASLGGVTGWVSSGWIANPYLETILNDPVLIRCGEIANPVFDMVDGVPQPREVLRVGDFAVPSNKLDEITLAAIELARGIRAEVCVTAQVGSDGLPVLRSEPHATACGHAVADGQAFWLRPAADQEADVGSQIKDPALVHPKLLIGPAGNRQSTNLRGLLTMMSHEGAAGCMNASVNVDSSGVELYRGATVEQCSIVTEYDDLNIKLRPAGGGLETWIKLSKDGSQRDAIPLNTPIEVYVSAEVNSDYAAAYAWSNYNYEREECA